MSLHENQQEIGRKIWAGEYFGPDGAVTLAFKVCTEVGGLDKKKTASMKLMLASTLYSAFTHCIKQVMRFRVSYAFMGFRTMVELKEVLSFILSDNAEHLDASEKEVLMAILLVCRFTTPFNFFAYRKMAIKLGNDVISEDNCFDSTVLLVAARLSRLWFYKHRDEYRRFVSIAIRNPVKQQELEWKTVNRLARLIGDKEMVKCSACKAESKDVIVKSGM